LPTAERRGRASKRGTGAISLESKSEAMSVNAGLSSKNPEKEGFLRAAVRFHLDLFCGRFWDGRHRALLRAWNYPDMNRRRGFAGSGSKAHKRGNSPPQKPAKKDSRGLRLFIQGLPQAGCEAAAFGHCFQRGCGSALRVCFRGLRFGQPSFAGRTNGFARFPAVCGVLRTAGSESLCIARYYRAKGWTAKSKKYKKQGKNENFFNLFDLAVMNSEQLFMVKEF
jgi:hypothetical protein